MVGYFRRLFSVWLLIVCFGGPMIALADEPTKEQVDEARRLLEVTSGEVMLNQLIAVVVNAQLPLLKQANPKLSDNDSQIFSTVLRREFQANGADLLDEMAKLYANHFSLAEIRELRLFWSSPLGQKFVASQPALLEGGVAIGQEWAHRHLPEIIRKAVDEMKVKRG